jgi:transposase
VAEWVRLVNRRQKGLEAATIQLAAVVSDMAGVSAHAMGQGRIEGETDVQARAEWARGRRRRQHEAREPALVGRRRPPHALLLTEHLRHVAYLDESMARFTAALQERLHEAEAEMLLLDPIPGMSRRAAEIILAEMRHAMGRFPSANQLASWAGMGPGTHESAGQRTSGQTRQGRCGLRQVLIEAAHGSAHTRHTSLAALSRWRQARRGTKKALVAVGHAILVIIDPILSRKEADHD